MWLTLFLGSLHYATVKNPKELVLKLNCYYIEYALCDSEMNSHCTDTLKTP